MIRFNQKTQQFEVSEEPKQPKLVAASKVERGQCFRKRTGTYVYLRISESAVRFAGMDEGFVWGVAYNGNLCKVKPETMVYRSLLEEMASNQESEDTWNETFAHPTEQDGS